MTPDITTPVDVIEVMDQAAERLIAMGLMSTSAHLDIAKAAIAELIAADEEFDAARGAYADKNHHTLDEMGRFLTATDRRRAALAKVKAI